MEMLLIRFVLGALAAGGLSGWAAARYAGAAAVAVLLALLGLAIIWMMVLAQQARGWDGIGYTVGALLFASPAALGVALGGWLGVRQRRRRMRVQA